MRLPGGAAASLLAVAPGPALLAVHCGADLALHVLSCNGRLLVSGCAAERLSAMAPSPDGRFLVTGGARGVALAAVAALAGGVQQNVHVSRASARGFAEVAP